MISALLQGAALTLFLSTMVGIGLLLKGCYVLRRRARSSSRDYTSILLKSPQMPMVSILAASPDASAESRAFVRRLLAVHCSNSEVVLVLNGASQRDFETWSEEFRESTGAARLVLLKTEGGDLAQAYQAAVAAAAGSLIAVFDPESHFVPEILLRLALPMLEDPDGVAAVCGVAPEIASNSLIEQFAGIEALRLCLVRCAAFSGWNMLLPVAGCCVLVRRDAIRQTAFASPLELILNLHGQARRGGPAFRMVLVPEPVSSLAPAKSEATLRRLLLRDQQALAAVVRHRKSIAGGLGAVGWGLPALLYWRVAKPLLETALYAAALVAVVTGLAPVQAGILVLLCTVGAGTLLSMSAVVLRELAEYQGSDPVQLAKLFFAAIPENLGYRQMRNLWLLEGFVRR
ncbi:MAG TPA: hypothetical protein VG456_09950 [Candidatus Sulfopaludibacter sp.]|jgi:hypothetical protein|nr:hypothetical protein [Candidatus Sulfopaludibacter sp.]